MAESDLDFQKIYDDFRPRILRYLTRMVGEYEAEDLTQEVFMRVSKGLPAFRGEAQLRTWIYRIATNVAIDRLRQPVIDAESLVVLPAEPGEAEVEGRDLWTGEKPPSLEQQVFLKQRADCYYDYIQKLPETYHLVVFLNQLGEYTAQEIADMLGLSVETVKMRLQRGKARLLEELKAHCKPEDWL